jgi:hypothetical protein
LWGRVAEVEGGGQLCQVKFMKQEGVTPGGTRLRAMKQMKAVARDEKINHDYMDRHFSSASDNNTPFANYLSVKSLKPSGYYMYHPL